MNNLCSYLFIFLCGKGDQLIPLFVTFEQVVNESNTPLDFPLLFIIRNSLLMR